MLSLCKNKTYLNTLFQTSSDLYTILLWRYVVSLMMILLNLLFILGSVHSFPIWCALSFILSGILIPALAKTLFTSSNTVLLFSFSLIETSSKRRHKIFFHYHQCYFAFQNLLILIPKHASKAYFFIFKFLNLFILFI